MQAKSWIAVSTHINSENLAVRNLERQGFECYCPQVLKTRSHARRTEQVHRPLFPGYLFVRLDLARDPWRSIMYSHGVRSVVRFGERLGTLPADLIEVLMEKERLGELRLPPAPRRFEVGHRVRIEGASFADLTGTILSVEDKGRIYVLIDLMRRNVKTLVSVQNLVAV